jgi:hypothetical protein
MRETLWFVASLAGAAILTALAVIVSPQSPLWRDVLVGGAYVLLVCAVLIFFDMRQPLRERPKMIPLIGMVVCGLGFLGCVAWYFWPTAASQDKVGAIENALDRKIIVNCTNSGRPGHGRDDRKLYTVEIGDPSLGVGFSAADVYMQPGGGELKWTDDFPKQMARCDLTNFSGESLFRVSFEYNIQ